MMRQEKEQKRKKSFLLPLAAGMMVILALIVVFVIPRRTDRGSSTAASGETAGKTTGKTTGETSGGTAGESQAGESGKAADAVAEINEEGNLVIYADRLSSEQVSFIRVSENSRIELLSRLGDDGMVKAALGTCQSCNGSPRAYYTQEGSQLKCNNCGLTFPVSVLDSPGGGCHPIMMEEKLMQYDGNDLVIDLEGLSVYEELFAKVADH